MATTFEVRSGDGTRLRAWANGAQGLPLLVSNGLGSIPRAWPALASADSGYDAFTWYYRGTFGSERPADPSRIRVRDHVDDALALLDTHGVERALVACWSIGVNVAFELAERHPDRVAGLLAVAGVQQDWSWYFTLAVAAAEHPLMDLFFVQCPVTLLAGRHDVLTSMHDVLAAAERIPHAQVTVLPGSHFLPLEHPGLVHAALGELARRSDLTG